MEFTNQFEVSLPPEQTWPLLLDVEAVVPCMPGAQLIAKNDDGSFRGQVSVRLGPVALVFVCDAHYVEIDQERREARLQASGSDAKGRGTANVTIRFRVLPGATGSKVTIDTDLELTGAVAQYGRGAGLIRTVAAQIISQFANNLEARAAQGLTSTAADPANPAAVPEPGAVPAAAGAPLPSTSGGAAYADGYRAGFAAGHVAGYEYAFHLLARRQPLPPPGGRTPYPQAKPIGGFSLFFASITSMVRGWFSRPPR